MENRRFTGKFLANQINKCRKIGNVILHKGIQNLSFIYLFFIVIIFHTSFCQNNSFKGNIIDMNLNVTMNAHYTIINNLNNVNSIEINGQSSNLKTIYHLDIGEYEIKIIFNKTLTDCSKLFLGSNCSYLDLSDFDTSQCTLFVSMFKDCTALTSIKFGNNYSTNKANDMTSMFENSGNNQFLKIDISNFNTSLVTNMKNMFRESSFQFLNLSNFDTSNVINMEGMFTNSQVISLDLSSFDTSKVTDMSYMFSGCNNLISLDISNFVFTNIKECFHKFYQINEKLKFCSNKIKSSLILSELNDSHIIDKCDDPCFTNKINKFIISNSSCIENCQNSKYKYEYNNICYSECPSGTVEYPNNSNFCIDNFESFHKNKNTLLRLDNISLGYYYDNETQKLNPCPKKCKTCEKESVIMELCLECNNDNFYYEIENSIQDHNNYIDCINKDDFPEGYYFESSKFKKCYKSCKNCTELGNLNNHKCSECVSNFVKMNDTNCYNICAPSEYYYFDDLNEIHCVNYCPEGYKYVKERQKCSKNCLDEFPYIFQHNNTCNNYEQIDYIDNYYNNTEDKEPDKVKIKFKNPLNLGDSQNSSDGYFFFNSWNISYNIEMTFKIKAYNFVIYSVKYAYIDNIDNLETNYYDLNLLTSEYKNEMRENENNYEINYFTIIKNKEEYNLSNGKYLIVFYFTSDGRAEVTNIKLEEIKEKKKVNKKNILGYILGPIAGVIVIVIGTFIYCKLKKKDNEKIMNEKKINSNIVKKDNTIDYSSIQIHKSREISDENLNSTLNINDKSNKTINEKIDDLKKEEYKIIKMDEEINSIVLKFISGDQIIRCAVICKIDRIFNVIVNKIYEDFPEFKKYEPVFLSGGKRITPYQSLEENGIKEDATIILNIMNE